MVQRVGFEPANPTRKDVIGWSSEGCERISLVNEIDLVLFFEQSDVERLYTLAFSISLSLQ